MKILIFGQNGQIAQQINQQIKRLASDLTILQVGHDQVNFLNHQSVVDIIENYKPTHIINAAAYTAVDKAELEKDFALKINGEILRVIGQQAAKINAFVFHFSTDYVFNGEKLTEYLEDDPTDPINYYGYTKLIGEQNLINSGCKHIILRIAWVYSQYSQNFLKTILRLAQSLNEIKVVDDQIGAPTSAYDISNSLVKIMQDPQLLDKTGLYHMAPAGQVTWFKYAQKIIELARLQPDKFNIITKSIRPITSEEFKTPAKRPKNSCMSTLKIKNAFNIELSNWEVSLKKVFKTL